MNSIASNQPASIGKTAALPIIGHTIPYDRFLDCVHCGLCTASCPTYVETGDENHSPRGRIYLMRAVVDGRLPLTDTVRHSLDLCLDCRSCETACPSGVQYGRLIEPFRVEMEQRTETPLGDRAAIGDSARHESGWFQRWILHGLFPYRSRMKWALLPARWMQKLRLDRVLEFTRLTRLLPAKLQRMQAQLPKLKPPGPELPEFLPATGTRRARVGLFIGCVADAMFRHVHWATARVLQANGCDVVIPRAQACCGAIHYHSGAAGPALSLMQQNAAAFADPTLDAVIVNVAGCGALLKDYEHIAKELDVLSGTALAAVSSGVRTSGSAGASPSRKPAATTQPKTQPAASAVPLKQLSDKIKDIHEFLAALGPIKPTGRIEATVAYQDACHLQHAQKIRQQPRDLMSLIPGITLKAIAEPELCCGAAGSYNLTQPEMADRLGRRKVGCLLDVKPDVIVSGNAGCSLQLQAQLKQAGSRVPVLHPMELLDLSYRGRTLSDV